MSVVYKAYKRSEILGFEGSETYKSSKIVALPLHRMAEPDITLKIVHIQHQSSHPILKSTQTFPISWVYNLNKLMIRKNETNKKSLFSRERESVPLTDW